MATTYCLVVDGALPGAVDALLDRRFAEVQLLRGGRCTLLEGPLPDAAALRALLVQLWDVGARVLLLAEVPDGVLR